MEVFFYVIFCENLISGIFIKEQPRETVSYPLCDIRVTPIGTNELKTVFKEFRKMAKFFTVF